MLRKTPETRPSRKRCIEVLQESLNTCEGQGENQHGNLMEAVSAIAIEQAQDDAAQKRREERRMHRDNIYNEAATDLRRIKDRLFQEIFDQACDVMGNDEKKLQKTRMTIGSAVLVFDAEEEKNSSLRGIHKSDPEEGRYSPGWGAHDKVSNWDIVAYTHIGIEPTHSAQHYLRSANLIYAKRSESEDYRWYELSFYTINGRTRMVAPHYLEYIWEIDKALSPAGGSIQEAHPPKPIDGEDEDNFISYWINIISKASINKLSRPSHLPIER
jgi:hypothetical protein